MDRIEKFLRKLDPKRWRRALAVIRMIEANALDGLDIRPLEGSPHHFRCRMGNIRFLFYREGNQNHVYDADFRGSIYKK